MNNEFPELNNEEWQTAIDSSTAQGLQGLVRALRLTTVGISNTRSQIGTNVGRLKDQIESLNSNIKEFNESSGKLTEKAIDLTKWIMIATIVSSVATLILAVDVILKWVSHS